MKANAKPTVRQVYALAAALCERAGEEFPETRDEASELIERLRIENGPSGATARGHALPPAWSPTRARSGSTRGESGSLRARS